MNVLALGALALSSGCYMEFGMGASSIQATAHGSIGVIAHFGEAGSVRAGAGGGLGPYHPPTGDAGTATQTGVALGGDVDLMGNFTNRLVISADVEPPIRGRLHVPDFDHEETATTLRGFLGLGWRHIWRQPMHHDGSPHQDRKEAGSVTVALGPELWYGDSKSALRDSGTSIGGALSILFEVRTWVLGELFECLSNSNCDP